MGQNDYMGTVVFIITHTRGSFTERKGQGHESKLKCIWNNINRHKWNSVDISI